MDNMNESTQMVYKRKWKAAAAGRVTFRRPRIENPQHTNRRSNHFPTLLLLSVP